MRKESIICGILLSLLAIYYVYLSYCNKVPIYIASASFILLYAFYLPLRCIR